MVMLKQTWVFDYWRGEPNETAQEEFHRLQQTHELHNDSFYPFWLTDDDAEDYPILVQALKDQGIDACLVSIWW